MPHDMLRPRATSYDVAREAGVSQPTVSRCFQTGSNISTETRTRVLAVAERLGYMPNALARSLITQRSDLIAVIVTRYTLRFNPDVGYALGESLGAGGKQLMLVTVDDDLPGMGMLRRVLEYPLGGIVSCVLLSDDQLGELRRRNIPVVLYNRMPANPVVDSISANHESASAELASLLHRAGHRRFLCIGGPADAPVSKLRLSGFRGYLEKLGAEISGPLHSDYSYTNGREALLAHMRDGAKPDAVFCANDHIAMGVMDACRFELGWKIPEELSVTGFDDVAEAARPTYELTTMHQASVEMAREAVRLLLARIDDPDGSPVRVLMPAQLMRRRSARLASF